MEAVIVQASVFTTSGSFGKAAYQTTMFSTGAADTDPIGNVYLSTVENSRDTVNIQGHRDNITNGSSQEFIIVFADMDLNEDTWIQSGAKLIINVPRTWEDVLVTGNTGFVSGAPGVEPSVVEHGDGTIQIIATTLPANTIGDVITDFNVAKADSTSPGFLPSSGVWVTGTNGGGLDFPRFKGSINLGYSSAYMKTMLDRDGTVSKGWPFVPASAKPVRINGAPTPARTDRVLVFMALSLRRPPFRH